MTLEANLLIEEGIAVHLRSPLCTTSPSIPTSPKATTRASFWLLHTKAGRDKLIEGIDRDQREFFNGTF